MKKQLSSCWLQLTAGRGPLECCRLVYLLAREIEKMAMTENILVKIVQALPAEETKTARSILLELQNLSQTKLFTFAHSYQGSVQWITQSPFRPHHKRKNWFAGVELLEPVAEKNWSMNDIKIETMRASGPGGQHVNKTESAVRITHQATGLTVIAKEERSQQQNKKLALARLALALEQRAEGQSKSKEQERWQLHNELERGNPVKIFRGTRFKEV